MCRDLTHKIDAVKPNRAETDRFRAKEAHEPASARVDLLAPPNAPRPVQHGVGVKLDPMLAVSASRSSRLRRSPLHGETPCRCALSVASTAQLGLARSSMSRRGLMPCMRCCRARCVFSPKLGIIIQDFARQLFDQLLADQAILMAGGAVLTLPPPIPVQRSHGFTRPTTRRGAECAPLTVKTYFRLAASGLRGKAAADNQSLRLHRPQATVSPTAAS